MARTHRKPLPIITEVEISDVAAEGKAIARVNDMVVFVPFAAPGDVVDLQLFRKRHKFAEGRVIHTHRLSPLRVVPFCSHFGICGGCKWQHLPYHEQLRFKQKQVVDNLWRIGKVALPEVLPIIGSERTEYYRNKLEFTFSNRSWLTRDQMENEEEHTCRNALGFHIPGMFDKVLDIQHCYLQSEPSNAIRNELRNYCLKKEYSFFDLRNQHGDLRTVIIRTASTGDLMVIVVFFTDDMDIVTDVMQHLADEFPQITSLQYVINRKANDTISDQEVIVFQGKENIIEEMEGLQFKVGPKSFYQTNSEQAHTLYQVVRNFASLSGKELVYDLYTGTGTIANFVARQAQQVIGIEYVPEAIADAKENALLNGLENTLFFDGDMKDLLTPAFIEEYGRPDVIITDPPRAGMHTDVVDTILAAEAPRIVYVSCNPASQARDLQLMDTKYRVVAFQPVDMFPHTHHVENVVLLELRDKEAL